MKNTTMVILLWMAMVGATGQNRASDKMYDALQTQEDVSVLSFSKNIIDMVDMNIGEDEDGKKVTGPLNEVRVAICKNGAEKRLQPDITRTLKKAPFEEVEMDNKDRKDDLKVYVDRKGKTIHECHVTIQGDENLILVSFYGEFRIEDVDKLKKSATTINWD
jgi:hypothetical protein